ncbi:MAG: hypothetical protein WDW38_008893 [Sanguina aurantia]
MSSAAAPTHPPGHTTNTPGPGAPVLLGAGGPAIQLASTAARPKTVDPGASGFSGFGGASPSSSAYVEASTELAVTQQAAAYAIVLAGEAIYSSFKLPETDPGRPNPIPVAIGVAGTVLVTSQVAGGNPEVQVPAFIGGLVVSGAMMAYCIKRGSDTTTDDNDWPGARAPAYVMALISFFALNVFFQGLKAAFI